MISAMPAVAVRREREKNRQGKLVGDPFGRAGSSTTSSNRLNSSNNIANEEKHHLRFLIYTSVGCLVIGLISLLIGIVTFKLATQIIGIVFIGLGGLFCIIKIILNGKSNSSPATTLESNNNHLNLAKTSLTQPLVGSKQPNKQSSISSHTKSTVESADCSNPMLSSTTEQCLEAS
uniref:Uncharacterized protein n=1 Tax=Tetranychus urticae TaxID=32264 RepID=T1K0V6_TETUR